MCGSQCPWQRAAHAGGCYVIRQGARAVLNCHSFELTDGGEGGGASTPACKRLFMGAQGLPALKQLCLGGMASKPINATFSQSLRQSTAAWPMCYSSVICTCICTRLSCNRAEACTIRMVHRWHCMSGSVRGQVSGMPAQFFTSFFL